jgi:hypothetical protein
MASTRRLAAILAADVAGYSRLMGVDEEAPPLRPGFRDTDIISAQHFWTGGLETAGPGCCDAVAIARAAGFRMLVISRIRHAAIVP